jgi:hypothetical protein
LASFNIEGAYYLNDYFGIGGRLRAMTMPVATESPNSQFHYSVNTGKQLDDEFQFVGLESSHLEMLDFQAGLFVSAPISDRVRLGTKLLVGNRLTTDYQVDAIFKPNTQKMAELLNGYTDEALKNLGDGNFSRDEIDPMLYHEHDFMKIHTNNTLSWGTGASVTYAYQKDISVCAFIDYDHAAPTYTYTMYNRYDAEDNAIADTFKKKSTMDNLSAGVGMTVFF